MASTPPLTIDVVSDVVCPWCFLGKRSLDQALAREPGVPTVVRWRPFQLDPTIPAGGIDREEYMSRKLGSRERRENAHRMLEQRGSEVGIIFAFDRIKRSPNTLDAHRLIRWAAESGGQDAVVDRLFQLYFSEGADIGDPAVLARASSDCGMDGAAIATRLASGDERDAVEAEIGDAARAGVTGVPCFIFAGKYAVSGAQPVDTLVDVIRQVAAKLAEENSAPGN